MIQLIQKILRVDQDSAARIYRTAKQLFVAVFLSAVLLIINGTINIVNAQASGTTTGIVLVTVLTTLSSIIRNKRDDGNLSGDKN